MAHEPAFVPPQPLRYWPSGHDAEQVLQVPAVDPPQPMAYWPAGQAVEQDAQAEAPAMGIGKQAQLDVAVQESRVTTP